MKPPITVLDEETVPWLEECNKSRVKTINSTTRTHRIICFSHIRNDINNYQTPLPLEYLVFILELLDFAATEMLVLVNKYLFHAFVQISIRWSSRVVSIFTSPSFVANFCHVRLKVRQKLVLKKGEKNKNNFYFWIARKWIMFSMAHKEIYLGDFNVIQKCRYAKDNKRQLDFS